jgi:menaquinone-9 beta-reductase
VINLELIPSSCDVLVVGAGPAGSACAQQLARAGFDVLLCDQHEFPRDKVCGDGLIPDAHVAMSRLGVYQEVMATACRATHIGCVGPSGERVDVPGRLSVLQREVFDDILRRAAVKAGASWIAPAKFEQPIVDAQDRVIGGVIKSGGASHNVLAKWVVLATGAVPQALLASGMCDRRTPSGVALRGYVSNAAMADKIRQLEVVWHKSLSTGYGWIFPLPGGVFNIGVGLAHSHIAKSADGKDSMVDANLRDMFNRFCQVYAPARELMAGGAPLGGLKGAPLRCSLEGAKYSRPGLLVTGEAAGSTYAFTGEGIGKAMETGILAAETIAEARDTLATEAQTRAAYEASLMELKPRFDLYERANAVNKYPWLMDLTIRRANKSPRILKRMAAVLEEKGNPGNLVSLRGVLRLFIPIP